VTAPDRKTIIAQRRQAVASLKLRGLSYREIVLALPNTRGIDQQPIIDHRHNKPWSQGTVHSDVKAIEAEWMANAVADISTHKARLNAEIEEVKRVAWGEKDTDIILKAIDQQRKIHGIDAPRKQEIGGIPGGSPIPLQQPSILEGIDLAKLTEQELEELERSVRAIDRLRAPKSGESTAQPS